jgi:hypothetical protein
MPEPESHESESAAYNVGAGIANVFYIPGRWRCGVVVRSVRHPDHQHRLAPGRRLLRAREDAAASGCSRATTSDLTRPLPGVDWEDPKY